MSSVNPAVTPSINMDRKVVGLLAEFTTQDRIMNAASKVRDAGYKRWDAFTPYRVENLPDAMGLERSNIPWVFLCWGLVGIGMAVFFQYWFNGLDYPQVFSGKPYWPLTANIPVAFELAILLASIGGLLAFFVFCRLPKPYHPLFTNRRFRRASIDRFFIFIEADDPLFNYDQTAAFLADMGPEAVEPVRE